MQRNPYSNNSMWVRTWAQIQMEASGCSPLRISDQVDRTMRSVAGGVVGPLLITITTGFICLRRRQSQLCELGCQQASTSDFLMRWHVRC